MRRRSEIILLAVLVAAIAAGVLFSVRSSRIRNARPHIRCVIELGRQTDTSRALMAGYSYYLLQRFAADHGRTVDIRLVRQGEISFADSLEAGAVDILVMPCDTVAWVTAQNEDLWSREVNVWLDAWRSSDEYPAVRDLFFSGRGPFRRGPGGDVSPYDSLFRKQADSLGLDWRLLCAVAWQESAFRIEASSRRGAKGLMQVMPSTGRAMGIEDLVDPERNICAGSRHLHRLFRRYRHKAADPDERYRFALAAYNAGEGRFDDCLRYAGYRNAATGRWEDMLSVMPEMSDTLSVIQSGVVELGPFNWAETIRYVDKVMNVYRRICRACPEQ